MIATSNLPKDFLHEAEMAAQHDDRARLILLQLESKTFPWQTSAHNLIQHYLDKLSPSPVAERVVLFTGHRIDASHRAKPRFPPADESIASQAIHQALKSQIQTGRFTGIAGGANGGDILFLEACRDMALPFQLLLALPEKQFISTSVKAPTGSWVQRFHLLAQDSRPRVLAQTKTLPAWLEGKPNYNFWARNNQWLISSALALCPKDFVLIALWDGQTGDGPGGTEDMVNSAQKHGAKFIHLDTRQLFSGTETIRTAKP